MLPPKTKKRDHTAATKCINIGPDLAGKWAVPNRGNVCHHVVVVHVLPEFFSPNADGSVVLGKRTPVHNGRGGGGRKKVKTRIGRSDFRWCCVFEALLLNIQTPITLSILEVRGSSLDSREFSITHQLGHNKWKYKKILVKGKQTVITKTSSDSQALIWQFLCPTVLLKKQQCCFLPILFIYLPSLFKWRATYSVLICFSFRSCANLRFHCRQWGTVTCHKLQRLSLTGWQTS